MAKGRRRVEARALSPLGVPVSVMRARCDLNISRGAQSLRRRRRAGVFFLRATAARFCFGQGCKEHEFALKSQLHICAVASFAKRVALVRFSRVFKQPCGDLSMRCS